MWVIINMNTSEIIDGNFFESLADCAIYDSLPNKEIVILYASTDNYQRAIHYIRNNPQQKFKLITHNSDISVENTYVPDNLIKWYAQNLNYKHPKIEAIPIGLENTHWHPSKRHVIDTQINNRHNTKRHFSVLCQFNPNTYKQERYQLLEMVAKKELCADMYYCLNGSHFEQYINNLINYKFCLCPRGNGIDTHRMWEAVLLGCIPIVKKYHAHMYDEELPVIFVDRWQDINQKFLQSEASKIDRKLFDTPILKKSYWKSRILS